MDGDRLIVVLAGAHSLGFAAFHMGFWRLFGWRRSLADATLADRAVIQILNVQLILVFLAAGIACVAWPGDMLATRLGRYGLGAMAAFWLVRLVQQFVFLRIRHPLVHALSLLFAIGMGLCAWPLMRSA